MDAVAGDSVANQNSDGRGTITTTTTPVQRCVFTFGLLSGIRTEMKHITCNLTPMLEKRCKEFCNVGI
jgi:hypothetical protein